MPSNITNLTLFHVETGDVHLSIRTPVGERAFKIVSKAPNFCITIPFHLKFMIPMFRSNAV
jgi:hypothetical protein